MAIKWLLYGRKRAKRSYSTIKVRRGSSEEIPFVQGKEQQLRFSGAAVKEIPKVREDTPKYVQGKRNPSKMLCVARVQ